MRLIHYVVCPSEMSKNLRVWSRTMLTMFIVGFRKPKTRKLPGIRYLVSVLSLGIFQLSNQIISVTSFWLNHFLGVQITSWSYQDIRSEVPGSFSGFSSWFVYNKLLGNGFYSWISIVGLLHLVLINGYLFPRRQICLRCICYRN